MYNMLDPEQVDNWLIGNIFLSEGVGNLSTSWTAVSTDIHFQSCFNQMLDQWNDGKLTDKRNTNGDLNMLRLYRKRTNPAAAGIPYIKKWKIMSGGGESTNEIRLYKRKNDEKEDLRVHDKKDVRLY